MRLLEILLSFAQITNYVFAALGEAGSTTGQCGGGPDQPVWRGGGHRSRGGLARRGQATEETIGHGTQ